MEPMSLMHWVRTPSLGDSRPCFVACEILDTGLYAPAPVVVRLLTLTCGNPHYRRFRVVMMWPSTEENKANSRPSSSTSKSSSASSCPSPFSPSQLMPTPRRKTMEDVWRDISLSSLQDGPSGDQDPNYSFKGMTFQDFLARPFKEQSCGAVVDPPEIDIGLFTSRPSTPTSATALSLNSGSLSASHPRASPLSTFHESLSHEHFCVNPSSSDVFRSAHGHKRVAETDNSSNDRRLKRMIKNRESAARSRARKQAYTNELELEVAHLMEENAKLRKQQQQLCVAASSAQPPSKHSLYRTSTSPF